jgi:hypothetical protein
MNSNVQNQILLIMEILYLFPTLPINPSLLVPVCSGYYFCHGEKKKHLTLSCPIPHTVLALQSYPFPVLSIPSDPYPVRSLFHPIPIPSDPYSIRSLSRPTTILSVPSPAPSMSCPPPHSSFPPLLSDFYSLPPPLSP